MNKELEEKFNIKINYLTSKKIKEQVSIVTSAVLIIAGVSVLGYEIDMATSYSKAKDSIIVFADEEYNISDLYLVLNEQTKEQNICRREERDDNDYIYYDSNNNIICQTQTPGYTVKKLSSIFNNNDLSNENLSLFKENDYVVDSDIIEEKIIDIESKYGK